MFIVCCDGNGFSYLRTYFLSLARTRVKGTDSQKYRRIPAPFRKRMRERIFLQLRLSSGQCANEWSESRILALHRDWWLRKGPVNKPQISKMVHETLFIRFSEWLWEILGLKSLYLEWLSTVRRHRDVNYHCLKRDAQMCLSCVILKWVLHRRAEPPENLRENYLGRLEKYKSAASSLMDGGRFWHFCSSCII